MSILLLILILMIVFAILGSYYAPWGWSPLGVLLVILIVLFLLGKL